MHELTGMWGPGLDTVLADLDKARNIQGAQESRELYSKELKMKNTAPLVQGKNIRNRDGNNPLTHTAFLRKLLVYIICRQRHEEINFPSATKTPLTTH